MKKIVHPCVLLLCLFTMLAAPLQAVAEDNYMRGDADGDNQVTIKDVTVLINYLLTGEWTSEPEPEEKPEVKYYDIYDMVSFKMVKVKGGTFTMGAANEQDTCATDSERPAHEVTLSDYWIGEFEVTQEMWVALMMDNPSWHSSRNGFVEDLRRPDEKVSWDECQSFIAGLNSLLGTNFRLPTEAEWEFAARGGNKSKGYLYAGSDNVDEVAWYNLTDQNGEYFSTQTVRTKQPNELGLYDMSGNVMEWCQDWYKPYTGEAQTNPTGPIVGTDHVYRGGGWTTGADKCRVTYRYGSNKKANGIGFRLAMSAE